jgi:methylated-DNA-[protein]-cysteine S-methyltransferase
MAHSLPENGMTPATDKAMMSADNAHGFGPPMNQPHALALDRFETPIGTALLVTDGQGFLRALDWSDHEERMHRLLRLHYGEVVLHDAPAPRAITAALADYFAGDLDRLRAVRWRTGGTPFRRKVWSKLQTVPAGKTTSYGEMAARLGVPGAARAVGAANGANPISVVVPCHRLVGASGALTGYGGGLARKQWLLAHEGAAIKANL